MYKKNLSCKPFQDKNKRNGYICKSIENFYNVDPSKHISTFFNDIFIHYIYTNRFYVRWRPYYNVSSYTFTINGVSVEPVYVWNNIHQDYIYNKKWFSFIHVNFQNLPSFNTNSLSLIITAEDFSGFKIISDPISITLGHFGHIIGFTPIININASPIDSVGNFTVSWSGGNGKNVNYKINGEQADNIDENGFMYRSTTINIILNYTTDRYTSTIYYTTSPYTLTIYYMDESDNWIPSVDIYLISNLRYQFIDSNNFEIFWNINPSFDGNYTYTGAQFKSENGTSASFYVDGSAFPYTINIVATDKNGTTTRGRILVDIQIINIDASPIDSNGNFTVSWSGGYSTGYNYTLNGNAILPIVDYSLISQNATFNISGVNYPHYTLLINSSFQGKIIKSVDINLISDLRYQNYDSNNFGISWHMNPSFDGNYTYYGARLIRGNTTSGDFIVDGTKFPYKISIVAKDNKGNTTRGKILVMDEAGTIAAAASAREAAAASAREAAAAAFARSLLNSSPSEIPNIITTAINDGIEFQMIVYAVLMVNLETGLAALANNPRFQGKQFEVWGKTFEKKYFYDKLNLPSIVDISKPIFISIPFASNTVTTNPYRINIKATDPNTIFFTNGSEVVDTTPGPTLSSSQTLAPTPSSSVTTTAPPISESSIISSIKDSTPSQISSIIETALNSGTSPTTVVYSILSQGSESGLTALVNNPTLQGKNLKIEPDAASKLYDKMGIPEIIDKTKPFNVSIPSASNTVPYPENGSNTKMAFDLTKDKSYNLVDLNGNEIPGYSIKVKEGVQYFISPSNQTGAPISVGTVLNIPTPGGGTTSFTVADLDIVIVPTPGGNYGYIFRILFLVFGFVIVVLITVVLLAYFNRRVD